jgi:hypothetical protein
MSEFDITYPKIGKKQKWLHEWWKKNTNTFLYALENKEIKEAIVEYRNIWLTGETAKTPEDLELVLKRIFLKDCEGGRNISEIRYQGCPVRRDGEDYYFTAENKETGRTTEWKLDNPFRVFDSDQLLRPETKMRLIKMLANPSENSWLFEPRYMINEEIITHPSSHNFIHTLHSLHFLRPLDIHVLGRYNLDYFVFWPMFFYYAITDDIDYVLKNVSFLHYPVKLFLVKDGQHDTLQLRMYGDCNFNEISNFIIDNKTDLSKINKLMGVPGITSGEIRDYHIYKLSKKITKKVELISELIKRKILKNKIVQGAKQYKDYLREASLSDRNYRNSTKSTKSAFDKEIKLVGTINSQIKKEITYFQKLDKYKNLDEVRRLIDSINKFN